MFVWGFLYFKLYEPSTLRGLGCWFAGTEFRLPLLESPLLEGPNNRIQGAFGLLSRSVSQFLVHGLHQATVSSPGVDSCDDTHSSVFSFTNLEGSNAFLGISSLGPLSYQQELFHRAGSLSLNQETLRSSATTHTSSLKFTPLRRSSVLVTFPKGLTVRPTTVTMDLVRS